MRGATRGEPREGRKEGRDAKPGRGDGKGKERKTRAARAVTTRMQAGGEGEGR